jgi:hypothetical protein
MQLSANETFSFVDFAHKKYYRRARIKGIFNLVSVSVHFLRVLIGARGDSEFYKRAQQAQFCYFPRHRPHIQ